CIPGSSQLLLDSKRSKFLHKAPDVQIDQFGFILGVFGANMHRVVPPRILYNTEIACRLRILLLQCLAVRILLQVGSCLIPRIFFSISSRAGAQLVCASDTPKIAANDERAISSVR